MPRKYKGRRETAAGAAQLVHQISRGLNYPNLKYDVDKLHRKYKGPSGKPELHGVVHQISEADMKQIQITEGGGGNDKMGYL